MGIVVIIPAVKQMKEQVSAEVKSIEFHPDKSKVLDKLKNIEAEYYMHDHKLENVDDAKYGGPIIH